MAEIVPTPGAEGVEIVVLGSFNPGIFHPQWFLHQKLIDKTEAESAETSVTVVGKEITEIQIVGIKTMCMNDRLSMSTSNASLFPRMEDLVHQIFSLLSHIPITACGINAHAYYAVVSREYWHKIGHTLVPKDAVWNELLTNPGMQSLTVKATRGGEFPGEVNLTVEPSYDPRFDPGIFVRSNYHYSVPKEAVHAKSAELLTGFLKSEFENGCQKAKITANKIFEKIKPDHD